MVLDLNSTDNAIYKSNHPDSEVFTYVENYLDIRSIDAFISMYLTGLGNFTYGDYSKGPNPLLTWLFFMTASFIICVVFMNMLIAIMGDTFGQV